MRRIETSVTPPKAVPTVIERERFKSPCRPLTFISASICSSLFKLFLSMSHPYCGFQLTTTGPFAVIGYPVPGETVKQLYVAGLAAEPGFPGLPAFPDEPAPPPPPPEVLVLMQHVIAPIPPPPPPPPPQFPGVPLKFRPL